MDNSTVYSDNMSVLSIPYKDSRPGTPASHIPPNPRVPPYVQRANTNSPLRSEVPLPHPDDYFTRPSSRGTYRTLDTTPGYTPGENIQAYELDPMPQRSYPGDVSDQTRLLYDQFGRARDPQPRRGGYM
jgi:hypothetical protein